MIMKHFIQLALMAALAWLGSCGNSNETEPAKPAIKASNSSDSSTNLSYDRVEVLLFESPAMSNTFRLGEQMSMNIMGIKGLNAKNGQFNLGMALATVSEEGDTAVDVKDIFEIQPVSFVVDEEVNIPFYIDFFKPYEANTNYTIHVKVWDKNGNGSFTLQKDIKVLPSQNNGFIKVEGDIALDYLIVYRNTTPYTGNDFYAGELINFTWALPQIFLDQEPAVKTGLKVYNIKGELIYEDSESATLAKDQTKISSKVYLKREDFPSGKYDFEQVLEAVQTDQKLIIKYSFEVKEIET